MGLTNAMSSNFQELIGGHMSASTAIQYLEGISVGSTAR